MNENTPSPAITPGIYFDITDDDYHAGVGISKSGLDKIHRSPAHYLASKQCKEEPTAAMILGSAVHAAVLQPDLFTALYTTEPDGINKRTKEGKEEYAAFLAENIGKRILSRNDYNIALSIRDVVSSHPKASELIHPKGIETFFESSIYWYDDFLLREMGLPEDFDLCKCRPDLLRGDLVVVDLKTTSDARPAEFSRSVANFRYHVQQAYYSKGMRKILSSEPEKFYFLCAETKPPYAIAIYELDKEAVSAGYSAAYDDLKTYFRCKHADEWPGYTEEIRTLQLPRWAA